MTIVCTLVLLAAGFAGYRKIVKRLDWQHDTIIPWINALNTKLNLPK